MLEYGLVQVAGVDSENEAAMLAACGVAQIGVPLRLPVHDPDLTEEQAAGIIGQLTPRVRFVLITYLNQPEAIAAFCRTMGVSAVQLHGHIDRRALEALRTIAPELSVTKSLVVGDPDSPDPAALVDSLWPFVDAFITDTFDPVTGASGATGKTHDWRTSRALVERSPRPVILAGGLTPANVRSAILEVGPWGVDVHSGVEDASGRKSPEKVEAFVREAKAAFRTRRS